MIITFQMIDVDELPVAAPCDWNNTPEDEKPKRNLVYRLPDGSLYVWAYVSSEDFNFWCKL